MELGLQRDIYHGPKGVELFMGDLTKAVGKAKGVENTTEGP